MNIPSSKGLFSPEATNFPTEGLKITPGLIENIGAIVDPAGTLLDYQRKQAAKTMAGVNFNGLLPLMKKKAMQETEKYLEDYQKLMSKGRGFNRTKLSYSDEIEMERRRNEIKEGVESLKQNTKDFEWAMNFGLQNGMTAEQFKEFESKYEEPLIDDKKGLGDVHNPKALMMDFVLKKGLGSAYTPEKVLEIESKIAEQVKEVVDAKKDESGKYTSVKGKNVEDLSKAYSDYWDSDIKIQKNFPDKKSWVDKNVQIRIRPSKVDKPPSMNVNIPEQPFVQNFSTDESGNLTTNISSYNIPYTTVSKGKPISGQVVNFKYDANGNLMMDVEHPNPRAKRPGAPQVLIETVPYDPAVYKKWQKATNNKGTISFPNVQKQNKANNPNYKGYDTGTVKDKTGKIRSIVWSDKKGVYVYAD